MRGRTSVRFPTHGPGSRFHSTSTWCTLTRPTYQHTLQLMSSALGDGKCIPHFGPHAIKYPTNGNHPQSTHVQTVFDYFCRADGYISGARLHKALGQTSRPNGESEGQLPPPDSQCPMKPPVRSIMRAASSPPPSIRLPPISHQAATMGGGSSGKRTCRLPEMAQQCTSAPPPQFIQAESSNRPC